MNITIYIALSISITSALIAIRAEKKADSLKKDVEKLIENAQILDKYQKM